MSLESHLRNRTIKTTAAAALATNFFATTSGCYFIFGSACPKPEQPIEPTAYCVKRDMPKEWRGKKDVLPPVMFKGPNSGTGWCYYQTSESRFFAVDDAGFSWNVDCDGHPVWIDQYYSGHGLYRNWEIYAMSTKFNQFNRDRMRQK
ncbi:hypothetical protein HY772_05805 [Candidatus Woesearchaeota archaeon]|nr:hypothetical protein [Candidatus Woesearchaeota archaeon]